MKKAFFWIAAACACLVADIAGDYNTWLGYLAGQNADGMRTTVVGAGAGGEASATDKSTYVGAASGTYSQGTTESVAIGYRAMRGATNCFRCVAIGSEAMQGESSASGCVVIGPNAYMDGMFRDGWTDVNGLVRGVCDTYGVNSQLRLGAPWYKVTDSENQGLDHWCFLFITGNFFVEDGGRKFLEVQLDGKKYRVALEPHND